MKTPASTGLVVILTLRFLVVAPAFAQDRPKKHLDFRKGRMAFEDKEWIAAASYMRAAEDNWEEDGERTVVYGRSYEPYLPRYYLGVALYRLGCYREALNHFDHSILCRAEIRWTKRDLENLQSLRRKAIRYVDRGIEETIKEDAGFQCVDWHIDYPDHQAGDCTDQQT
jgi:tetratricopeptide (TPR) repeat protein